MTDSTDTVTPFVELTLLIEKEIGSDSVPTIDDKYRWRSSTCECVFPGCHFRRRSPVEMWFHVHMSKTHPARPDLAAYAAEIADLDPRKVKP